MKTRQSEADTFYKCVTPTRVSADEALVMRQALAGMLWFQDNTSSSTWTNGSQSTESIQSKPGSLLEVRNRQWFPGESTRHLHARQMGIIPGVRRPERGVSRDRPLHGRHGLRQGAARPDAAGISFLHPTGQIPAYEWNFGDIAPPVHAWASIFLYRCGTGPCAAPKDTDFLKRTFAKLTLNFSWWVNRKDRFGNNLFEGGFLGLDNIGVFDRSAPLPTGGSLEQADGTAWVAMFSQNMLEIAVELAAHDAFYEDMAIKFAEHFIWIAVAMNQVGTYGMWDEEDGFYYDLLRLPDGSSQRLKVRSMVGLLPLCATTVIEPWQRERMPRVLDLLRDRLQRMPELRECMHATGIGHLGYAERGIAALVNEDRLRRF